MANGGGDPYDKLVPLTPKEVDFLAAVAKRAYQSVLRHPALIKLTSDTGMRREAPSDMLYVASLAFQLPDPAHHGREVLDAGSEPWRSPSSRKRYKLVEFPVWRDLPPIVEDFIQAGKERGAWPHFVLLNELAHAFANVEGLAFKWRELANTYKTYIVPGTFNCTTEYFAVAPIYCPDPNRFDFALKQNAATKQGEIIRTPDARELFVFDTDFGNIVIWICLDMYDPGQVLKFLNITHRFTGSQPKREIALVLVPSFSSDSEENIDNCVKAISQFSKTAMVCTNSFFPSRLGSHGFSCGEPLQVVFEKDYPLPGLAGDFCRAKLFGVNLKHLKGCQAANYPGIFSSTFSAIINGGPYVMREIPD